MCTGDLPADVAKPSAASTVCAEVAKPGTTSTSFMTGTGLKKCNPIKRSGALAVRDPQPGPLRQFAR